MVNDKQSAVGSRRSAVFVYIVECADQTLYTGWTTNIERRLKAHNAGRGAKYTQQRGPVRLVYSEELPNRGAALKREMQIKRMSRAEKLKLIEGYIQILAAPLNL
jgi:putative endonuclease